MSNETMKKSLRDRLKEFNAQLPIMTDREKADVNELIATVCTINDFDFLSNEAGEPYAVFTVKERPGKFYFGGSILTDRLLALKNEGYYDVVVAEGIPTLMTWAKSKKSNRNYVDVSFPEE